MAACATTPVWVIAKVYVGPNMNIRGRLVDHLPPRLSLRLRAERNVRRLLGMHEAADLIIGLVPRGRNAVDVGANRGVYTSWMAKRADRVDAFEPQPALAKYISDAHLRHVHVHETALSDHPGVARLLVPGDDGLARIASSDPNDAVSAAAETELGVRTELGVTLRTLDSFGLTDVGFLKIDAEGHELAVLRGASETIRASRPVVFIESEARHAPGAPGTIIDLMREGYGYGKAAFVRRWALMDIEGFDVQRDQTAFLPDFMSPDYVSNFVFWPDD
jgi:FkbM family methyltransferase